jgi:hypothetical protein
MSELSLSNIDQIARDVRNQEITFSHLPEDLIDHVCCDVENEMQRGTSFAEAYRIVKIKMGPHRINEIQEETLYAVDTKYRNMKKTMKISGVAGTILMGFAAMFKIQHWPYAAIMLTLGALILAFVFMPSALNVLWKETHNRKKLFLFISAFFAGMFFILGIVFRIQHWPGAGILLSLAAFSGVLLFIPALVLRKLTNQEYRAKIPVYILGTLGMIDYIIGMFFKIQHWPMATTFMATGMVILCFLTFPIFTWITWKEENHISSRFIYMVIGFILIIIPGTMISLNLENSYQNNYYRYNSQQTFMNNYLFKNNRITMSRLDSLSYQRAELIHDKTRAVLTIISNIEEKMVLQSESALDRSALKPNLIYATEAGKEIEYSLLSIPFDTYPPKLFLSSGSNTKQELNVSLAEYASYLTTIMSAEDVMKYKKVINTETFLSEASLQKGNMTLMSALHSLEMMKSGLLTVESYALNEISKH